MSRDDPVGNRRTQGENKTDDPTERIEKTPVLEG